MRYMTDTTHYGENHLAEIQSLGWRQKATSPPPAMPSVLVLGVGEASSGPSSLDIPQVVCLEATWGRCHENSRLPPSPACNWWVGSWHGFLFCSLMPWGSKPTGHFNLVFPKVSKWKGWGQPGFPIMWFPEGLYFFEELLLKLEKMIHKSCY